MESPFLTACSSSETLVQPLIAQAEPPDAGPLDGCDEPRRAVHEGAIRRFLKRSCKAVGGGFPPCCPDLFPFREAVLHSVTNAYWSPRPLCPRDGGITLYSRANPLSQRAWSRSPAGTSIRCACACRWSND